MPNTKRLPEKFADLEPFVADWALPTMAARHHRRLTTTHDERRAFYDAINPHLREALAYLDGLPLRELPAAARNLLYLTLTLAEMSLAIEVYTPAFEAKMAPNSRRMSVTREIDGL